MIKDNLREDTKLELKDIAVNLIAVNPYQPRQEFNGDEIISLSQSIKVNGLIQPIVVRKLADSYQLIAGERRLRAIKELGQKRIKALVKDYNEQEMMELSLVENLQREDLNPIEEAKAYQRLISQFELTQKEVAKKVGKSRSAIANSLRLLDLPTEIQAYVSRETVKMGHARALLSLSSKDLQIKLAKKVIKNSLTVREVEKLVKDLRSNSELKREKGKNKNQKVAKNPELSFIEDRLRDILSTRVKIKDNKKKGKIVIEYYSPEDLKRILDRLEN